MANDEKKLTKGQLRKLNALRKSVGNELGEDVFSKWLAQQAEIKPKADPIVEMIGAALAGHENDPTFRRARGKGTSGFSVSKNEKPK